MRASASSTAVVILLSWCGGYRIGAGESSRDEDGDEALLLVGRSDGGGVFGCWAIGGVRARVDEMLSTELLIVPWLDNAADGG